MTARNVLLVTIDSLRADELSGERATQVAPRLTGLADGDRGLRFTEAVANGPNTPSSFPTILTGTHPMMYGGYRYLDERRPFLSATLREAGFTTVGYHSNPHLGPEMNYNAGFDTFNDGDESKDDANTLVNFVDEHVDSDSRLYSVLRRGWHLLTSATGTSAYDRAESITDDALGWLADWNGDRFFMWLHYMDVHYPFQPPARFVEAVGGDPPSATRTADLNGKMQENPEALSQADHEELRTLYRAELRYVDHAVGQVLDALADRGALSETLVVATADHGEAFGEHGRYGHHPYMYDELLRVPLFVQVPEGVDAGLPASPDPVDRQVSLVDLSPTVYEACDVPAPDALQGRSLFEAVRGEGEEDVALGTSKGGEKLAARTSDWKYLWHIDEDSEELYDLAADPDETTDVADDHPDAVERFRDRLEEYRAAAAETDTDLPAVETSADVEQRLRELGYVD